MLGVLASCYMHSLSKVIGSNFVPNVGSLIVSLPISSSHSHSNPSLLISSTLFISLFNFSSFVVKNLLTEVSFCFFSYKEATVRGNRILAEKRQIYWQLNLVMFLLVSAF
uniref:Uncharacterized protein n=1 Tax=Cucumis melo TaxID=3656 RepID=A0A9I9EM29_CUCME